MHFRQGGRHIRGTDDAGGIRLCLVFTLARPDKTSGIEHGYKPIRKRAQAFVQPGITFRDVVRIGRPAERRAIDVVAEAAMAS